MKDFGLNCLSLAEKKKKNKKPQGVPIPFDRPWRGHDVVLLPHDDRNRKLYAKKATLIAKSIYFEELFIDPNRKANEHEFHVDCDYDILFKMLQHTHQPEINCWRSLTNAELPEAYYTADRMGIDSVKEHCRELLLSWPSVDSAHCALKIGLHDVLMDIIQKLKHPQLMKFVKIEDDKKMFSKNEVFLIYEKIYGQPLEMEPPRRLQDPIEMEDMLISIPSPRIDLTQKWHASDLAVETKKAKGRLLYVNKGLLACYSEKLHNQLLHSNTIMTTSRGPDDIPTISVDFEYAPMFLVFSLLHHCDQNFCADNFITVDPIILYNMYLAAVEFDLPIIKKFVTDQLFEQADTDCFHVALKLKLPKVPLLLIHETSREDLRKWIFAKEKDMVYLGDGDKVIDLSSNDTEPLLSLSELRKLTIKL